MGAIHNLLSQSRAGKPGIYAAKRHTSLAVGLCEQVQLLLAAKMLIFCRLPRAGDKTAVDTDLHAPLNDAHHVQGRLSGGCKYPPHDSGTGKPVPLLCGERAREPECRVSFSPFRQGQQCIWPEYSSLRSAWAFSFRLRRHRERWRGGRVGKKENRGSIPRLPLIICL